MYKVRIKNEARGLGNGDGSTPQYWKEELEELLNDGRKVFLRKDVFMDVCSIDEALVWDTQPEGHLFWSMANALVAMVYWEEE